MMKRSCIKVPLGVVSNGELVHHEFNSRKYNGSLVINGDIKKSAKVMCSMVESLIDVVTSSRINITLVDFSEYGCFDQFANVKPSTNVNLEILQPYGDKELIVDAVEYLTALFSFDEQEDDSTESTAFNIVFLVGLSLVKERIDKDLYDMLQLHISEVGSYGNKYATYLVAADRKAMNTFGDGTLKWFERKIMLKSNRVVAKEFSKLTDDFEFEADGAAYLIENGEAKKLYVSI